MIGQILAAARADSIPAGDAGLWFIRKFKLTTNYKVMYRGKQEVITPGIYTHLFRMTDATMHLDPPGAVVMEDTLFELKKHLEFMLKASGNILVTGLGLGCVVRGLLANPNVKHVTCVEKSTDVLALVSPYMPKERLTIIQADALEWTEGNTSRFDYAWHDLWTDRCKGEPHLDLWHSRVIFNCVDKVKHQGAWGFSRIGKEWLRRHQKMNLVG